MVIGSVRATIYTTKILSSVFSATVNSFLSMISTLVVVDKVSAVVYVFQTNFCYTNRTSAILKVRKSISKTTSRPILANKKVS